MQEVVGSTPIFSTKVLSSQSLFFMAYYVYIIYSATLNQYYVGHTENLDDRIFRHNNSGSKATKKASDWKLFYTEEFENRSEAIKRELEIKRRKSRKYIESLVRAG